jgi:hypothetical protein
MLLSPLARQKAVEQKKEEMIAKAREEKELKENNKKEKEKQRKERERGRQGRGEPGTSSLERRERGFSIDKLNTTNDWSEEEPTETETELERDKKRAASSPAFATPDSKAVKTVPRRKGSQSLATTSCHGSFQNNEC